MSNGYLKPNVAAPRKQPVEKSGMFVNPPPYPEFGGFNSAKKIMPQGNTLTHEGKPSSRGSRPF